MTPNLATLLGVLAAAAVGLSFYLGFRVNRWMLLATGPLLGARMAFNALDGMLAREKLLADRRGEVLNEVSDALGDCLSFLPAAFFAPTEPLRAVLFLVVAATLLAEFTGVLGKAVSGVRRYEGPLGGKSDRALWFGLGAGLLAVCPASIAYGVPYASGVLALILLTAANRLRILWRSL